MTNNRQLIDVYYKQVRIIMEFATPVWSGGLTYQESEQIERVQKSFCAIILGPNYHSYNEALSKLKMVRLSERRVILTKNFAIKSSNHPRFNDWFKLSETKGPITRSVPLWYCQVVSNKKGLKSGPIAHMTNLLNMEN